MHSKGNHRQIEETTLRMGENICQWSNWQGITAHAAQYQKKKQTTQSENDWRRSK